MTDKELRKLSRKDLLQLLLEQSRNYAILKEKYAEAQASLQQKEIILSKAGSIAEASLQLSGIFEAAERACKQYTDSIASFDKRQEEIEKNSTREANRIIEEAKMSAEALEKETKAKCEIMLKNAERESQSYWDEVYKKIKTFMEQHNELKKCLSASLNGKDALL